MTQRVLATAGAPGIGRAIAQAFAASGPKVFACDIDTKGLGERVLARRRTSAVRH